MLKPIPQTGVTGGRVEPSSPPHDRGHDGPQSVAGDPAILRRTGRTADVRPRRNNQPRSAALSGMRRGHEGHRRPSPRRPMGLDPRHRRSGATLHEPGLDDPTDNLVSRPCHRAAVETTCALTASQPASHAVGARSRHKRTPASLPIAGKNHHVRLAWLLPEASAIRSPVTQSPLKIDALGGRALQAFSCLTTRQRGARTRGEEKRGEN
jgi:hypothetical protein